MPYQHLCAGGGGSNAPDTCRVSICNEYWMKDFEIKAIVQCKQGSYAVVQKALKFQSKPVKFKNINACFFL